MVPGFLEVSKGSQSAATMENHCLGLWTTSESFLKNTPRNTTDMCLDLIPIEILYGFKGYRCGSWYVFGFKKSLAIGHHFNNISCSPQTRNPRQIGKQRIWSQEGKKQTICIKHPLLNPFQDNVYIQTGRRGYRAMGGKLNMSQSRYLKVFRIYYFI